MSTADYLFEQFSKIGISILDEMKENQQEEGLFIDFKNMSAPHIPGMGKTEREKYAQAISGYSNSSGGIIVWGVDCRSLGKDLPDVLNETKPIQNLRKFLTDLKNYTHQATDPINNKVQNIPLYINEKEDIGFVVSYVPESDTGPHRSQVDNEYYTRIESSFKKMSHSQIADMFGRRQKPTLNLEYQIEASGNVLSRTVEFRLHIYIKNSGRYIAIYPALTIKASENLILSEGGIDGWKNFNLKLILQNSQKTKDIGYSFSGGINDVIHPNTSLEICVLTPKNTFLNPSEWYGLKMSSKIFTFIYILYAEGCQAYENSFDMTYYDLIDELEKNNVTGIDHLKSKMIDE